MKKLIPVFALVIVGCTSPKEKSSSCQMQSASQKNLTIPANCQEVVPGEYTELNIENVRLADGSKVSLDEFSKLNESGGTIAMKLYVDESGQTNYIVVDVEK